MQPGLRDLLEKRRNRAIAIILGVKERELDAHLPPAASQKLRKVVLDQLNEFHDIALDVLEALSDNSGVVLNELYLEKIDAIYEEVVVR